MTRWLYRLQQRAAVTRLEAAAVLAFALSLAAGYALRATQDPELPGAAALYAAADSAFAAADSLAQAASGAGPAAGPEGRAPLALAAPAPRPPAARPPARAPRPRARSAAAPPPRMNINTANAALLERLPRIGPALAGRIIEYRTTHGPFRTPQEIVNVRGIGDRTYEQLAPYIYTE